MGAVGLEDLHLNVRGLYSRCRHLRGTGQPAHQLFGFIAPRFEMDLKRGPALPLHLLEIGICGARLQACHVDQPEQGRERVAMALEAGHGLFAEGHGQGTLIEKVRNVSSKEAIRMMREWAGDVYVPPVKKDGKAPPRIVRVYDYLDADGKLKHQTLRYEPKMFRQRRPAAAPRI